MPGYVYGLDPASKVDYFGIAVHELPKFVYPGWCYYCDTQTKPGQFCEECGKPWPANANLPKLKNLRDMTGMDSFSQALSVLEDELFPKMPPTYIVADYTNEKTFTDLLVRDYGKEFVEPINFTIPSKLMLKQDGLSIIKMGYEWPDPRYLPPEAAIRVRNCVDQLIHEQVITTKSGKITFDHEPGRHNDLAIGWELSIHGCLKYILRRTGHGAAAVGSVSSSDMMKKTKKRQLGPTDMIDEITRDGNNTITGVYTRGM